MNNLSENQPVRSEQATVRFFDGLEVKGWRMPSGEFRIGLEGASSVLGFAENWLSRTLTSNKGKTLKTLQGYGFDDYLIQGTVDRPQGGSTSIKTISLDSFNCCIVYAVQQGKKPAIALQKSFAKIALNDFFRDAFGERPLSIEEKRRLFYETYAASISPVLRREMDREEILALALPGDEPQLLGWNS